MYSKNKIILSVLLFVFLSVALFLTLVLIIKPTSEKTVQYITDTLKNLDGKNGLTISFDRIYINSKTDFIIDNLNLKKENGDYLNIENVEINVSLFQLLYYKVFNKNPNIPVVFNSVTADLKTDTLNLVLSLFSDTVLYDTSISFHSEYISFVYSDGTINNLNTTFSDIDIRSSDYDLEASLDNVYLKLNDNRNISISIGLFNSNLGVSEDISAEIIFNEKLNLYFKSLDYYMDSIGRIGIKKACVSLNALNDNDFDVLLNFEEVSINKVLSEENDIKLTDFSCLAELSEDEISLNIDTLCFITNVGPNKEDVGGNLLVKIENDSLSGLIDYFTEDVMGLILQILQNSDLDIKFNLNSSSFFSEGSYLDFSYQNKNAVLDIQLGNDRSKYLNGKFSLDLNTLLLNWNLLFDDFYIYDYDPVLGLFLNDGEIFYKDDTLVNGNFNGELFLNFNNPVVSIDTELSIHNVLLENREVDLDFVLKSELSENILYFNEFIISLFDFKINAKGEFDIKNLQPNLYVDIYNMNLESKLASLSITPDPLNGTNYNYNIISESLDKIELDGSIDFIHGLPIKSSAILTTAYQKIPLEIEFNPTGSFLRIYSKSINLDISMVNGILLNISISLRNLIINPFNTLTFDLSMELNGYYNLVDHLYSFYVDDLILDIPNSIVLGGDADLKNGNIVVTDFWFIFNEQKIQPDGNLQIKYNSLTELLNGQTESLDIVGDFKSVTTEDKVSISVIDNAYKLEINLPVLYGLKVFLLGERGSGFYAECSLNGFDYKLRLYDRKIQIFGVLGKISSFDIDNLDFYFDLDNFSLGGSVTLSNGQKKATLNIDVTQSDLRNGLFSLLGSEQPINVILAIKNATLGAGYNFTDTEIILTFYEDKLSISGDLINGKVNLSDLSFQLNVHKDFLIGFNVEGSIKDEFNLIITDLYLPLDILNCFIDNNMFEILPSVLTGDLLITGDLTDPIFYGSLFVDKLKLKLFWLPEQTLSMNNIYISVNANEIIIPENYILGSSSLDRRFYDGYFTLSAKFDNLSLSDFQLDIYLINNYLDFWLPMYFDESFEINLRGDVKGHLILWFRNSNFGIGGDIILSDFDISFKVPPNMPDWFYEIIILCSMDLTITMGKNVNFFYPEEDNSFLNFTFNEGEKITVSYDSLSGVFSAEGSLSFKTGRFFYFHSDFIILDGNLSLSKSILNSDQIDFSLNLRALLRQYDVSGQRVDIYLILRDSTLDNISPRLESIPEHTENEIIQMLGNEVIPTENGIVSLSSIASLAASATSAFSSLGVIGIGDTYSLSSTIRQSLGLDLFTIKSPIIENIVLDVLPGLNNDNISLVSRYFNGTSIYAGKYINPDVFARLSLSLRSQDRRYSDNSMLFLADDLKLDLEISFDWDNPIGSFSIFSQVQELSVIGFLDTIGFSFTRRFSF